MEGRSLDGACPSPWVSMPGSMEGGKRVVSPRGDTLGAARGNCTVLPHCGHSPSLPVCSGGTGSCCWQCGQEKVIMLAPEAPCGRTGRKELLFPERRGAAQP